MSVGDSIVGTLVWLAPEVFQQQGGQSSWSEFSDVWSFGVVLWELLAREMPHAGVYPIVVAHWNKDGQTLQLKDSWPLKWKEIMEQCWSLTPTHRPTFESLVQSFEEYTKGLVEVHISDLPGRRKKKRKASRLNCLPARYTEKFNAKLPRNKWILIGSIAFLSILGLSLLGYSAWKPKSMAVCSNGYVFFNTTGYCYKTSLHPTTQKLATANCADDGATLATIHSREEDQFVLKLYNDQLKEYKHKVDPMVEKSYVWIGYEYDRWKCEWVWADGLVSRYHNWDGNEQLANRYFWTIMHPEKDGKWSVADDKREAAFICKKPNTTEEAKRLEWGKEHPEVRKECASGYTWLKETGFCYKIEFDSFTYPQATEKCASENAHLISIHNSAQHSAIVKFYKTQLTQLFYDNAQVARTYIWLGLTYENDTWNWSDGTDYDFQNWAPQTPRDEEMEYYWSVLAIESDKPGWTLSDYWRDVGSNNFFAFICQKNDSSVEETSVIKLPSLIPNITRKTVEVMDKTLTNCSDGYEYFEVTGYCYKSGTESLTVSEATRDCKKEGALLASVHSKEESDFIIDLAQKALRPERIYIGLQYNISQWMNTDGTEADYWNWMQGEPNFIFSDLRNSETKVAIILGDVDDRNLSHDKWSNLNGKFRYGYVCKKKAF